MLGEVLSQESIAVRKVGGHHQIVASSLWDFDMSRAEREVVPSHNQRIARCPKRWTDSDERLDFIISNPGIFVTRRVAVETFAKSPKNTAGVGTCFRRIAETGKMLLGVFCDDFSEFRAEALPAFCPLLF